jgi:glycosyltransferase involved in cell wall biosynthesis/peptidoglycan/xylan/chitin deacetylase (PgdA/CDA1 family)
MSDASPKTAGNLRAEADREAIRIKKVMTGFFTGGTELQVLNLVRGLDRDRFDLSFACLDKDGDHLKAFEALDIPIQEFKIRRLYHPHCFRQQVRFASLLRQQRIQILHSYNFYSNVFAVPAARMAGVPVVLASVRDQGVYLNPAQKKLQALVCGLADRVLVNAGSIRDWLIEQGLKAEQITVIRNGIDLSRYPIDPPPNGVRKELGIPESAPIIMLMARINPKKGIDDFIKAAALVLNKHPEAYFLVVGASLKSTDGVISEETEYRDTLLRLAESLKISDHVIFTGLRDDTPDLLAETTISVLPSLSEGLSNTLLESMAAGVPTIATDVGGNPELVKDGINGRLVPVQAPDRLASAINDLLADPDLLRKLGAQARIMAEQGHALPTVVGRVEQLYREELARAELVGSAETQGNAFRRLAKTGVAVGAHWSRMDRAIGARRGFNQAPLVLGYHRVVENFEHSARNTMASMLISTRALEQHLDWIGKHYRFVSMDELAQHAMEHLNGGGPRKRGKPLATVTFDDGYRDVYEHAFPLLQRKGIPFTTYVVTGLVGTDRLQAHDELFMLLANILRRAPGVRKAIWETAAKKFTGGDPARITRLFQRANDSGSPYKATRLLLHGLSATEVRHVMDDLHAEISLNKDQFEPLLSMDWSMLKDLVKGGATVGSHTRSHVLLASAAEPVVKAELEGSRRDLEQELGVPIRHLAYPDGSFTEDTLPAVEAAGYLTACTASGKSIGRFSPLAIPRRMLWEGACQNALGQFSPAILSSQINGLFDGVERKTYDY